MLYQLQKLNVFWCDVGWWMYTGTEW